MIQKAIEKIKREMEEGKDKVNLQTIGNYLLKQIEINRSAAENISDGTKTIAKALEEVEAVAKKLAGKSRMAMISDSDVFEMVRKYYGFEAVQNKILEVELEEIKEDCKMKVEEVKSNVVKVNFSASLDDYM
ncbi:MAG: hypothetical protein ACRC68_15500 [Clostridium sp.]